MSYPCSNAAFVVPLPSENQECFLQGLKLLFHQAKGVPKKIRIDNLTPAVKKIRSKFEATKEQLDKIIKEFCVNSHQYKKLSGK